MIQDRPLRALVLAAGLGTRLGPLSDERPKPLVPVCDLPLIRYAIALLAGHGVTEIAVNLHHKGELIERELGTGADLGVSITYSREAEILALIAEGRSTKEIARALSISPRTVDTHRAHIAEKLETTSVAEMVRLHLVGADR